MLLNKIMSILLGSFPSSSDGKAPTCSAGDLASIPRSGRPLEKEMGPHASILA